MRKASPLALLVLLLLASTSSAGDPGKDLKDADPKVRITAIDALGSSSAADAEALLIGALSDKDGEVVERAAKALSLKSGDLAIKALAKLCLDSPARRTRLTAARALAASPRRTDGTALLLKAPGSDLVAACEAGAVVADRDLDESLQQLMDRGLAANEKKAAGARAAAARLLGALPPDDRAKMLQRLGKDEDTSVAAAALDSARYKPDDATTQLLIDILLRAKPALPESVERRARGAFVSAVAAKSSVADAMKVVALASDTLAAAPPVDGAMRLTRLLGDIADLPDDKVARADLAKALLPAAKHADAKVRAVAAWSYARVADDAAGDAATLMAKEDADARVRLIALLTVARLRPAEKSDAGFRLFLDRLQYDTDPIVREEAAVALGREGLQGAVLSLQKAVDRALAKKDNSEWALGTVALVSMGRTRDPAAVAYMTDVYEKAKDWRLRASAIVGLGHVQDRGAVPVVISALGDKDPQISTTAFEILRRLTEEQVAAKEADWKTWWDKNGATYRWIDREAEQQKAAKFGYAADLTGVYAGLDVVVLATRGGGDRIEEILKDQKVEHRMTRAGSVPKTGLTPYGLFVANCPGELNPDDVEPIAWFVRSGGYLFNSCWALHETIEKVYPGVLRKFQIPAQVIDNVVTEPAGIPSPFIDGVFRDLVQPVYCLEGAHLIEVIDKERAEVLTDSPWTEEKYGSGNMVAWFRAGHGLVLDSANHFEEQGLAKAAVRTPEDRIAYAADHLGLSWAEIRAIDSKAWKSPQDAGRAAKDLSCFRLITNFVREKRKSQE